MAFHPDFAENGLFFVDYTDADGDTQVERWSVSADDPDRADPAAVETLLTVDQPYPNHNGGLLLFGPDGYLYVGLGDGGAGGDPDGNGQDFRRCSARSCASTSTPPAATCPTPSPPTTPSSTRPDARPEIWACGLRNPWRFSFDRATGDLYIGDVGQGAYEEINLLPAGGRRAQLRLGHHGRPRVLRGDRLRRTAAWSRRSPRTPTASAAPSPAATSTGARRSPALRGVYLFADYCTGQLWGLGRDAGGEWLASAPIETGLRISSFGEDAAGELYVVDLDGAIYRIVAG